MTQAKEKIDNTQLLKDTGLRIRHFNVKQNGRRVRSMTVAYRDLGSSLEIATSVVHPKDCFCRKLGTKLAINAFQSGKTTRIPKLLEYDFDLERDAPASAAWTLTRTFG